MVFGRDSANKRKGLWSFMSRPTKVRIIRKEPPIRQFSPRGKRGRPGYTELKLEELEAIRLSDHLGLDQRESAKFMGISQQTYSRVLKEARKCVAGALINGNIIRIKGGEYELDK